MGVTREAMRSLHTIRFRHTDWRPVADAPVASGAIDAIRVAVEVEHAWLHTLRPSDVLDLATAADRAQTLDEFDPQWREEIAYWVRGVRHDDATIYAILFGTEDTPSAWLHAGEALSAAWLTAIEHGLSVLPLSAVAEVETTRMILSRAVGAARRPLPGTGLRPCRSRSSRPATHGTPPVGTGGRGGRRDRLDPAVTFQASEPRWSKSTSPIRPRSRTPGADAGRAAGRRLAVTSRSEEPVAFDPVLVLRHPPVAASRTVEVSEACIVVSSLGSAVFGWALP